MIQNLNAEKYLRFLLTAVLKILPVDNSLPSKIFILVFNLMIKMEDKIML